MRQFYILHFALKQNKSFNSERGISILLTVFFLSLMLAISLGIFEIIYNELLLSGDIRASFFALYAADEILERTAYLDRTHRIICTSLVTDCWETPLMVSTNNVCNSVRVSKNIFTGFTEIFGSGQYPSSPGCVTSSPFLAKRSFVYRYPMIELENLNVWLRFDNEYSQTVFDWTKYHVDGYLGMTNVVEDEDATRQNTIPNVVFGGAVQFFDNQNDLVTIPNSPSTDIGWPISIVAWACHKSSVSGLKTILRKGGSLATQEQYGFYINQPVSGSASLLFQFKDVGGTTFSAGSNLSVIPLNSWTQVAVTYDGSVVRFYVNGIESSIAGGVLRGESITLSSNNVVLGRDFSSIPPAGNFNGVLDEVMIFSKTLQPVEVDKAYKTFKPQAANLSC